MTAMGRFTRRAVAGVAVSAVAFGAAGAVVPPEPAHARPTASVRLRIIEASVQRLNESLNRNEAQLAALGEATSRVEEGFAGFERMLGHGRFGERFGVRVENVAYATGAMAWYGAT
jgi:hypothetical protein